ncbi:MAG TPA: hypothetical protein VJT82_04610 [Pyrinomonadaceae bacterium]|nr:hypothetical protein [Pyrinomonadaceae bacterium]
MKRNQFRASTFVAAGFSILLVCAASATQVRAQNSNQPQPTNTPKMPQTNNSNAATPAANPSDVSSLDAILAAVYDVISGPKGKARDWDRFRSLFVPGARLIPTGKRQAGDVASRVLTVEEFIAASGKFMEDEGFVERGVANHVDTYANIAQVFSVYEGRRAGDTKPFVRGINSFQFMNDGKRWWVVTIFWQAEDAEHPVPEKYLKGGK